MDSCSPPPLTARSLNKQAACALANKHRTSTHSFHPQQMPDIRPQAHLSTGPHRSGVDLAGESLCELLGLACDIENPCLRSAETALEVEGPELWLVVNVDPGDSMQPGLVRGSFDQLLADALASMLRMYGGVEDKGVRLSVPGDVDEAHQLLHSASANVSHAVTQDGAEVDGVVIRPRGSEQLVQRKVVHRLRDRVFDV
jgi:hypothetical protein